MQRRYAGAHSWSVGQNFSWFNFQPTTFSGKNLAIGLLQKILNHRFIDAKKPLKDWHPRGAEPAKRKGNSVADNSVNEAIHSLLTTVESLDKRIDICSEELDSVHVEWQRDRGIHIRLEAQIHALFSILVEILGKSGVAPEHVATCFYERFVHFQDKALQEAEAASPDLAAHIDTRVEGEIPTDQGPFQPLFPAE